MFSVHIIITCRYVFRKYYTDDHDVDEDMRTICTHGGQWVNTSAGITMRTMNDTPTSSWDHVASKK